MTDTKPTETVEDLIRQLDDRCTELSEAESMIEMLKAGATDLRVALVDVLLGLTEGHLKGATAKEIEKEIRETFRSYDHRLTEWDKAHSQS